MISLKSLIPEIKIVPNESGLFKSNEKLYDFCIRNHEKLIIHLTDIFGLNEEDIEGFLNTNIERYPEPNNNETEELESEKYVFLRNSLNDDELYITCSENSWGYKEIKLQNRIFYAGLHI